MQKLLLAGFVILYAWSCLAQNDTDESVMILNGHNSKVSSVSVSADGEFAVSGSDDRTLKYWSLTTGECLRTFTGHSSVINSVAFVPSGQRAISASHDKTLKLWNITGADLKALNILFGEKNLNNLSVSTNGCITTYSGHSYAVNAVAISANGQRSVSGSTDKSIKYWNVETGECLQTLTGHTNYILCVAITADGKYALSGSADNSIKLWNLTTGRCELTLYGHTGHINHLAITADGKYALSGSTDRTIKVWDITTGNCLRTIAAHSAAVNAVAISPDGKYAFSGSADKSVKFWETATGTCLHSFSGHTYGVNAVTIVNGNKIALSSSDDRTIRKWNLEPYQTHLSYLIKKYVEAKVEVWQTKGEFEKIADYTARVTEVNRQQKVSEFTTNAIAFYKQEYLLRNPLKPIALSIYDSENETYLVTITGGQELAVPVTLHVPMAEAALFKQTFDRLKVEQPELYIHGETFKIAKFILYNPSNGKRYIYTNQQAASYAAPDVKFNFSPIEITLPASASGTANQPPPTNNNKHITENTKGKNIVIPALPSAKQGRYFALLIGAKDYNSKSGFTSLDHPINDVKNFANSLRQYKFDSIQQLINPTKTQITATLYGYRKMLGDTDNLLIFYSGHGYWDAESEQGYWIPTDANNNNPGTWVSNSDIKDQIKPMKCNHVLLISDACFSGAIFKTRSVPINEGTRTVQQLYNIKSRKAMTSGALTEVPDKSVFIKYLIAALNNNTAVHISSENLFWMFKENAINNTTVQGLIPQFGTIADTDDRGGDFIFIKK